jgi:hypothetical protein
MIQGLHPKMVNNFISVKPKTFCEFYHMLKQLKTASKEANKILIKLYLSQNFKTFKIITLNLKLNIQMLEKYALI